MATIYPNRKDGKIVSFKFKVFLGKEASGKHIVKCKTWVPDREMTEKRLRALAEKEVVLFEYEAAAQYEEEQKRLCFIIILQIKYWQAKSYMFL